MQNKKLKIFIKRASLNAFMTTLLATGIFYSIYGTEVYANSENGFYNFMSFEPMDYFKEDSDHDGIIDMYDKNPNKWNITDRDLRFFQELAYRSEDELNAIFNRKDEAAMDKFNNDKLLHAVDIREISPYWRFVKQVNKSNGFSASIFSIGDQAVLAIRGTDGGNDVDDDTRLALRLEPGQAPDAKNMYYELRDFSKIYVTGHSLGGYLATYYSATAGYVDDEQFVHGAAFNAPGVALSFVRSVTNKAYEMTHTPYIDDSDSRYIDQKNKMQYYKVSADTVGGMFYVDTTRLFDGVNSGGSHSSTNFFPTKRSEELKKWFSTGYRYDNVFLPDDSDNDGIVDYNELRIGTDPKKKDSDNDGYSDKLELSFATNPISSDEHPLLSDFYNFVPYTIEFNDSSEVTKEKIRNRVSIVLKDEARNMTNDIPTNLANIQSVSYSNYPENWSEQPREGYNLNVNVTLGDGSTVSGIAKVVIRNNPTLAEIQERNRTRITISEIESKTYDSNPVAKPEINVENPYDQSPVITILKKNGDRFEVISTFDSLDELTMPTNAGEYQIKAVIENENEFKAAQASREFTIRKKDNGFSTPLSIENWTEGDEPNAPVAVASYNNDRIKFLYSSNRDSGFEENVPTAHGTYYVKAVVDGDENYNSLESEPIEFSILERIEPVAKKDNSFSTPLSIENWTEGDEPNAPVAVASHNNDRIKFLYSSNRDSGFEENVPTYHGTYYVKAVVDGDENYNSLESEPVEFNILEMVEPIAPKDEINENNRTRITISEIDSKTYDSNPVAKPDINVENPYDQSPVITILKKDGDGFNVISTFNSLDELTMPTDAGEYQIKAVIENENEFKAAQTSRDFTIRKKDNSFSTDLSIENWTEGDEPNAPVAVASHNNDRIKFLYSSNRDSGFEDNVPTSHDTYYVKAVVEGDENYNSLESEPVEFSILERVEPINDNKDPVVDNTPDKSEPIQEHKEPIIEHTPEPSISVDNKQPEILKKKTVYISNKKIDTVDLSSLDPQMQSIKISQQNFESSDIVIIVNKTKNPDILSATSLSSLMKAPILLTDRDKTTTSLLDEIKRLGAKEIIFIGGDNSISPELLDKFVSQKISRIFGKDRYETSAQIAEYIHNKTGHTEKAFIASGEVFADSALITPQSGREKAPILLTKKNAIPNATKSILSKLGVKKSVVIGGRDTISSSVEDRLKADERIHGKDRYDTGRNIYKKYFDNSKEVWFTPGDNFVLSLLVSSAASVKGAPILYYHDNNTTSDISSYMDKMDSGAKITVFED